MKKTLLSVIVIGMTLAANAVAYTLPIHVLDSTNMHNPETRKAFYCQDHITKYGDQKAFNKCMDVPETKETSAFIPKLNGMQDVGKKYYFEGKKVSVENFKLNGVVVDNSVSIISEYD